MTGTFVFAAAFSQDIEAVKKQMYYERWNGAEQVLNQMIRADSSNLDNYYWLAEVLIEDKDLEKAKAVDKHVQDYVAAHPAGKDDLLYRVAHAEIMLQAGDSLGAAQIFDDLLKQTKEKNPQVLLAIANAWMHTKSPDYNEVLNLLDRAQKRDKNDPEIFSLRGDVYRRLNDGGKAVQVIRRHYRKIRLLPKLLIKLERFI
jgi:predicted Zn-dependent protease